MILFVENTYTAVQLQSSVLAGILELLLRLLLLLLLLWDNKSQIFPLQ